MRVCETMMMTLNPKTNVCDIVAMIFNQTRNQHTLTVQMKNWLPLVLGPAFAILRTPGPVWDTAGHSMYQKYAISDALKTV